MHEIASGNNGTLFDHHTDDSAIALNAAAAARMVVTGQAFGFAGLSGLKQKFTDGPCTRGALFLAQGETLFETLVLNFIRYDHTTPMPVQMEDKPAWEQDDPFVPDRDYPLGYLDYLTWQNRHVLLVPDLSTSELTVSQMTMTPGLRLNELILQQDTMKHYRIDEKRGHLPLRITEDRALWRDSAALFRLQDSSQQQPAVFRWLSILVEEGILEPRFTCQYLAYGMSNHQAKVNFYRGESMPLPVKYLIRIELVDDYLTLTLQMAEAAGKQLWAGARTLARHLLTMDEDRQPAPEDLTRLTDQMGMERRYCRASNCRSATQWKRSRMIQRTRWSNGRAPCSAWPGRLSTKLQKMPALRLAR